MEAAAAGARVRGLGPVGVALEVVAHVQLVVDKIMCTLVSRMPNMKKMMVLLESESEALPSSDLCAGRDARGRLLAQIF